MCTTRASAASGARAWVSPSNNSAACKIGSDAATLVTSVRHDVVVVGRRPSAEVVVGLRAWVSRLLHRATA